MFTPIARVRWRWLTAAGFLTYPLHLMHELWGEWLIELLHPALPIPMTLGIVAAAMLLLAYAIHRLVERPLGRRLRRGLGVRRPRRPAVTRVARAERALRRGDGPGVRFMPG